MRIEVTVERLRAKSRGKPMWVQHAFGKFEGADMEEIGPKVNAWMKTKNLPRNPEAGWALRVAVTD